MQMFRVESQYLDQGFQGTIGYEVVAEERAVGDVGEQDSNVLGNENIFMRE